MGCHVYFKASHEGMVMVVMMVMTYLQVPHMAEVNYQSRLKRQLAGLLSILTHPQPYHSQLPQAPRPLKPNRPPLSALRYRPKSSRFRSHKTRMSGRRLGFSNDD